MHSYLAKLEWKSRLVRALVASLLNEYLSLDQRAKIAAKLMEQIEQEDTK